MTQKNKELLLKDLCSRLPCGVIVRHADCIVDSDGNETGKFAYIKGYLYDVCRMDDMTTTIIVSEGEDEGYEHICFLERTLPYLRPMSSMTEEELAEFTQFPQHLREPSCKMHVFNYNELDWLNAHHFDYRGLIELGLALEAPDGMYNLNEKKHDTLESTY